MSTKPRRNDRFVSFANPPAGSVLAAATDELTRIAATGDITDPVMLRRVVISALERQGMPPGPRPPWSETLIDKDVTLTQQQLAALASAPPRNDSPNAFAV